MQLAWSRIWTRVAVSISYDDNHYTTNTSSCSFNTLIWMVSILSLVSNQSSPFSKPLGTVPNARIINGINVTLMFHGCFSSLARSKYFSIWLLLLTTFCSRPERRNPIFFFLLIYIRFGLLTEISWSVCIPKILFLVYWNYTAACKLLIFNRYTWNHLTVCQQMFYLKYNY